MPRFVIYRIAEFGDFIVYRRGAWARREHLPMYLVSNQATGRDLEEFRRKQPAVNWASRTWEQEQRARLMAAEHQAARDAEQGDLPPSGRI